MGICYESRPVCFSFSMTIFNKSTEVLMRYIWMLFIGLSLFNMPSARADLSPFFAYKDNVAMVTYGTGLHRQLLSLFLQQTFTGTRFNTLYTASYFIPGTVWGFPLRHRFEVGYQGNTLDDYKDYTYWTAGWLPEALISLYPVYMAFGFGPYLRSRATPVSAGHFAVVANVAVGITIDPVNLECFFRHHSNAYTGSPNHGADFFGVALSYSFDPHPF